MLKSFAIDSEIKVMNKYLNEESLRKYFIKEKNLIKNSNGRGNNWAMGYDINFKEFKQEKSLVQDSIERINSFIEKCDFLRGFMFIHSLYGGTGSGISTRLIEMLRDEYPKFNIIDVAIKGLDGKIKLFII
jgi:tubulin gamma